MSKWCRFVLVVWLVGFKVLVRVLQSGNMVLKEEVSVIIYIRIPAFLMDGWPMAFFSFFITRLYFFESLVFEVEQMRFLTFNI